MQEFPWVTTDQHQVEDIPDANTIPLKSISSSILKVSCRMLFVCLFVSSNLAVVGGGYSCIGRENLENYPAGCIVNHVGSGMTGKE